MRIASIALTTSSSTNVNALGLAARFIDWPRVRRLLWHPGRLGRRAPRVELLAKGGGLGSASVFVQPGQPPDDRHHALVLSLAGLLQPPVRLQKRAFGLLISTELDEARPAE